MPKKVIEKRPIYDNTCPRCGSKDTISFWNSLDSSRKCEWSWCRKEFNPRITGYKSVVTEVVDTATSIPYSPFQRIQR